MENVDKQLFAPYGIERRVLWVIPLILCFFMGLHTTFVHANSDGQVFSRTDKTEYYWVATDSSGVMRRIYIDADCVAQLGGFSVQGNWNDLIELAADRGTLENPCSESTVVTGIQPYVFSRTDKTEYYWVASDSNGVLRRVYIPADCVAELGGVKSQGVWNDLIALAADRGTLENPCSESTVVTGSQSYVFSRTDKTEYYWIASDSSGVLRRVYIPADCVAELGGVKSQGNWNDLIAVASERGSLENPCGSDTVLPQPLEYAAGNTSYYKGVNVNSAEFWCQYGFSTFDHLDYMTHSALADRLKQLRVNVVRIPLNAHCALGFDYVTGEKGQAYRSQVKSLISVLRDKGIASIVDAHWTAPSGYAAIEQKPMPDETTVAFWEIMAPLLAEFGDWVTIDVFNEPFDVNWDCWRDGCQINFNGVTYQGVGMQALVNAVRSAGSTQRILIGGLDYAGDLSGVESHMPVDPLNKIGIKIHVYDFGPGWAKSCVTQSCWNEQWLDLHQKYGLVATEVGAAIGGSGCPTEFVNRFYSWADANQIGYLGWSYYPLGESDSSYDCTGPNLIKDWAGNLTKQGEALFNRF